MDSLMNFDMTLLVLSIFPSTVGLALFMYGKKLHRFPQLLCGILLMVYPYFVSTTQGLVGIGLVLCAALYIMIAVGW
jgi:hypothetical protein